MLNLSVALLGSFEAILGEQPLPPFRTKSVQALLIYLLCEADQPHQREALMTLLWPDLPLLSAQANMRQTLYRLRKLIPEVTGGDGDAVVPFLLVNRQTIQINPDADYFLDVDAFVKGDPAQVITLYRGDFLVDFYLPDSEAFEEWAANRRAHYRRRILAMMEELTAVHLQQANYDEASQLAHRQLEIDNLRESSHRQLMEAWARNGRRQEALTHYNHLRQLLQAELAVEPSQETRTLIEAIHADAFAGPTSATILFGKKPETPKHNLPQRLTSFIGRKKEMAAIMELISQNRLVMLTGVGGIGKTNLCLQVGRTLLDSFPDGVWLVELAPLADPALIPQTAVATLGLPDSPSQPALQTLLNYLQEKSCLLILDNCEHLINAAAQFGQTLLRNCPDLKILASSREALGVPGEMPFHVPSLSIPDVSQNPSLDEWQQYDALHLFVERARARLPNFRVTADNITPLMQICRRLDGIPLALELAAARVKMLTLAQIAERLDDRFRLLTGGSRTALPRQQTLRALIDWSWELLTKAEQLLLQRLSVFASGMDLEAVEAICTDDGLGTYDILDVLSELVNKSLVIAQRQQGKSTRYHLLETIRQYAQERLFLGGQGATFRQRHLDYFRHWAEQAEPELVGSNQADWMRRLERELDNIRAALNWAREINRESGLRLLNALLHFWFNGFRHEGEAWLEKLLADTASVTPDTRARALWCQGMFNYNLLNHERSQKQLKESLALYEEIGDQQGIARTLRSLTTYYDSIEARALLQELLIRFRTIGDKLDIAYTLLDLSESESKLNNYKQAQVYLKESESLFRELGHLAGIAGVLSGLGQLTIWQGEFNAAHAMLEESLALYELLGQKRSYSVWIQMGELYFRQGDFIKARDYFEKSLNISRQNGDYMAHDIVQILLGYVFLKMGHTVQAQGIFVESQQKFKDAGVMSLMILATEGIASLYATQERPERAIRLFAWADTTRKSSQNPRTPSEQADVDRETAIIRQMIGEETYHAAYAEGQAMTMEQAIAQAKAQQFQF